MIQKESSSLEIRLKELEDKNSALEDKLRNVNSLHSTSVYEGKELDLLGLWKELWASRKLILLVTIAFAFSSVLYAINLPDQYRSTAILVPASPSSGVGGLSKLAGQFGGVASLAGINLTGSSEDKSIIAIELIKNWGFLEEFIRQEAIEVELIAVERWDPINNKLIIDPSIYDKNSKKWVRDFDPEKGERPEPGSWELYQELNERISISKNAESGLISISIDYYSPIIAKEWLDKLVVMINSHVKAKDKREAMNSINYLEKQIEKTNVAEMQNIFYQLIEEQTKTLMLAEVSSEYVLKTISPAKIAEEKFKPKRSLICVFITLAGGVLSIVFVAIRYQVRDSSGQ